MIQLLEGEVRQSAKEIDPEIRRLKACLMEEQNSKSGLDRQIMKHLYTDIDLHRGLPDPGEIGFMEMAEQKEEKGVERVKESTQQVRETAGSSAHARCKVIKQKNLGREMQRSNRE